MFFPRGRTGLFLLLFTVLFVATLPTTSWAARMDDCFSYEAPRVTVTPFLDTPRINTELGLPDIRNIYGFANKSHATVHEIPVGVTSASLQIETTLEITTRTATEDSLACAQITGIDFRFGFADTTIYVARELPYGTCAYQTVLEHEFKHVETDRIFLNDATPHVSQDIRNTLKKIGRVRGSSPDIAKSHLQKSVDDYTNRLSTLLTQMRENRQKYVDSPEEYERISAGCNGDIRRLISRYLP